MTYQIHIHTIAANLPPKNPKSLQVSSLLTRKQFGTMPWPITKQLPEPCLHPLPHEFVNKNWAKQYLDVYIAAEEGVGHLTKRVWPSSPAEDELANCRSRNNFGLWWSRFHKRQFVKQTAIGTRLSKHIRDTCDKWPDGFCLSGKKNGTGTETQVPKWYLYNLIRTKAFSRGS